MYKCEKYSVKIEIQLDNGLYIFTHESASGKTRLGKELRKIQMYDNDTLYYTYDDKLLGINLADKLKERDYRVILIDRYDMYSEYCITEIKEASKKSIVLIDSKGDIPEMYNYEFAFIDMTADKIEVSM